jgi:hypothetical protein
MRYHGNKCLLHEERDKIDHSLLFLFYHLTISIIHYLFIFSGIHYSNFSTVGDNKLNSSLDSSYAFVMVHHHPPFQQCQSNFRQYKRRWRQSGMSCAEMVAPVHPNLGLQIFGAAVDLFGFDSLVFLFASDLLVLDIV